MPGRIVGSFVALLASATVFLAAGTSLAREASDLIPYLHFSVTPSKLSPTKPALVQMTIGGKYRTQDETQVPALKELRLQGDKHIELDLEGVPPCRPRGRGTKEDHSDSCPRSVVGRGTISIEIAFPGDQALPTSAPLTLWYTGRSRGGAQFLAYAYLTAPASQELPLAIEVRRVRKGRIGWEAVAAIPKIAGGSGSITGYSLTIGKRFLSATCVSHFELRAVSILANGTRLRERSVRPCAVSKADVRQ
jgi:hypothetical protein